MRRSWRVTLMGMIGLMTIAALSLTSSVAQESGRQGDLAPLLGELKEIRRMMVRHHMDLEKNFQALIRPTWEYLVIVPNRLDRHINQSEDSLEALGKKGWELVTFHAETGYIFKRRTK